MTSIEANGAVVMSMWKRSSAASPEQSQPWWSITMRALSCSFLNTLAEGREVVVSRGELVEIGGAFRIPDVMKRSGALLREVGTTNRTHLNDYQKAIGPQTALLLKVHTSNFRVLGFTSDVPLQELVQMGKEHHLPVMEDLGSGCLVDLTKYGLEKEPTVQEVMKTGVDVVTFSGDKLLGGPQAGIILGKKEALDLVRANPLTRALRIDKLTLAALESTLLLYLDEKKAMEEIPTLQMLTFDRDRLKRRGKRLLKRLAGIDGIEAVLKRRCLSGGRRFSSAPGTSHRGDRHQASFPLCERS